MAKGIYVGVAGVARKVNKIYVGVAGVARKVKKIYVGVAGLARLAYSAEPSKISNAPNLDYSMFMTTPGNFGVTIGTHALFAYATMINAYTSDLVKSTPSSLTSYKNHAVSASNTNYAIYTSGNQSDTFSTQYDVNLTRSENPYTAPRAYHTGASSQYFAFFGTGRDSGDVDTNVIDCIDNSLNKSNIYTSRAKYWATAGCVKNNLFVAGGYCTALSTYDQVVDLYIGLVRSNPTSLSTARAYMGTATVDDYIIFAGGYGNGSNFDACDVYNSAGVKQTNIYLSEQTQLPTGVSTGEYALFSGGYTPSHPCTQNTVVFDKNLIRSSLENLATGRRYMGSALIGDKVLIAGGLTDNSVYPKTVEVYQL